MMREFSPSLTWVLRIGMRLPELQAQLPAILLAPGKRFLMRTERDVLSTNRRPK